MVIWQSPSLLTHTCLCCEGETKGIILERTVKEQEQVVADMKLHMVQASAEQIVSQHALKKVMRDNSVEKQLVENQMIAKDMEIKQGKKRRIAYNTH